MVVRKVVGFGLASIGGLALVGAVFGSDVKIYGRTGERIIQEKLDDLCGVATKLEVLKTRVRELDGECVRLRQATVTRQVELDTAKARVRDAEGAIERQRKVLARAAELLDEGRDSYEISGRGYSRSVVEEDARSKLEACRTAEKNLENEKRLLAIHERTIDLSRSHLERALTRRGELAQVVRSLEARIAQQQAKRELASALDQAPLSAEVVGELAKAEKLAKELDQKLAVEERVLDERLTRKDGPTGMIDYDTQTPKPEADGRATNDVARSIRSHLTPAAPATPAPAAPAAAH